MDLKAAIYVLATLLVMSSIATSISWYVTLQLLDERGLNRTTVEKCHETLRDKERDIGVLRKQVELAEQSLRHERSQRKRSDDAIAAVRDALSDVPQVTTYTST